jgi:hypothetical protein
LEESLPDEDLTILTDSLVAMITLFSLCRADFPLSQLHSEEQNAIAPHTTINKLG